MDEPPPPALALMRGGDGMAAVQRQTARTRRWRPAFCAPILWQKARKNGPKGTQQLSCEFIKDIDEWISATSLRQGSRDTQNRVQCAGGEVSVVSVIVYKQHSAAALV
ncbi:hypothetical protein GPALN_011719 [Globodera pallida]|nr:hypothetical protein GPALN_011719 [Globodera pallida]